MAARTWPPPRASLAVRARSASDSNRGYVIATRCSVTWAQANAAVSSPLLLTSVVDGQIADRGAKMGFAPGSPYVGGCHERSTNMSSQIEPAKRIASTAPEGQTDKLGAPHVAHPEVVATFVEALLKFTAGDHQTQQAITALHASRAG